MPGLALATAHDRFLLVVATRAVSAKLIASPVSGVEVISPEHNVAVCVATCRKEEAVVLLLKTRSVIVQLYGTTMVASLILFASTDVSKFCPI
jgi:hypothetical protein